MKPVILTLVLLSPGGATSVEYPEERLQANRPLLERTNENNCACGQLLDPQLSVRRILLLNLRRGVVL